MMTNYDIELFAETYNIKILNDTQRKTSHLKEFFTDPTNANFVKYTPEHTIQKVFVIEIPENSLSALVKINERFFTKWVNSSSRYIAQLILEKESHEVELRKKNASVNAAWEQYSLMLHLASSDNHESPS